MARNFLTQWAEKRKPNTALGTYQAYSQVSRDCLKSLGERASLDISQINKADIVKFRDEVARLTWQNLDTQNKVLRFVTAKTGRRMPIPLLAHIETLTASDDPAASLFPEVHAISSKKGSETGKGRSQRRTVSEISFTLSVTPPPACPSMPVRRKLSRWTSSVTAARQSATTAPTSRAWRSTRL